MIVSGNDAVPGCNLHGESNYAPATENDFFCGKKKLDKNGVVMVRQRRDEGGLVKTLMKDYNLLRASISRYIESENT